MLLKILTGALLTLALLAWSGCIVRLQDKGELELFFGTSIGLRSSTSETKSESEAELKPQTLTAWFGKDKAPTEDAPGTQPNMGDPP